MAEMWFYGILNVTGPEEGAKEIIGEILSWSLGAL